MALPEAPPSIPSLSVMLFTLGLRLGALEGESFPSAAACGLRLGLGGPAPGGPTVFLLIWWVIIRSIRCEAVIWSLRVAPPDIADRYCCFSLSLIWFSFITMFRWCRSLSSASFLWLSLLGARGGPSSADRFSMSALLGSYTLGSIMGIVIGPRDELVSALETAFWRWSLPSVILCWTAATSARSDRLVF